MTNSFHFSTVRWTGVHSLNFKLCGRCPGGGGGGGGGGGAPLCLLSIVLSPLFIVYVPLFNVLYAVLLRSC